ncbi:30S ribosomal protein S30 [Candidatus Bathyarchaeota archaeon ex4484_205]|nr:MAG: 30S ribosomal protein S30 [Candidatus Bathyarchaeota archaeon ex4484_205]HDN17920.1 30S ribosomal protein S30 [Candidatus Bathyarchaeota archaeon]
MVTHGSITQAGKVRSVTPKLPRRERRSPIPRARNRINYRKRFVLKREPGQQWLRSMRPY